MATCFRHLTGRFTIDGDVRLGTRLPRVVGMIGLTAIAVAGIGAAQRADAAPVVRAQLHQACGGCDVNLGPPFFTGGTFLSGTPDHLDKHLVLQQQGVVRQRMLNDFVPGPRVEVQGRAIAMPGSIGTLAESGSTAQTFDEFASTASAVVSQAQPVSGWTTRL